MRLETAAISLGLRQDQTEQARHLFLELIGRRGTELIVAKMEVLAAW